MTGNGQSIHATPRAADRIARRFVVGWMVCLLLIAHLMALAMMHWQPWEHLRLLWEQEITLRGKRAEVILQPGTLTGSEVYYVQRDHRIYRVDFTFPGAPEEVPLLEGRAFWRLPKDASLPERFDVVHIPGHPHLAHPVDGTHALPHLRAIAVTLLLVPLMLMSGLLIASYRHRHRRRRERIT